MQAIYQLFHQCTNVNSCAFVFAATISGGSLFTIFHVSLKYLTIPYHCTYYAFDLKPLMHKIKHCELGYVYTFGTIRTSHSHMKFIIAGCKTHYPNTQLCS